MVHLALPTLVLAKSGSKGLVSAQTRAPLANCDSSVTNSLFIVNLVVAQHQGSLIIICTTYFLAAMEAQAIAPAMYEWNDATFHACVAVLSLPSLLTKILHNEAALGAALCSHQFQKIVIRLFVIDEFIILLAYHNRN